MPLSRLRIPANNSVSYPKNSKPFKISSLSVNFSLNQPLILVKPSTCKVSLISLDRYYENLTVLQPVTSIMQFVIVAILSVYATAASVLPTRQDVCADVCSPIKPVCSANEEVSGIEGCWGCCQPAQLGETICADVCSPVEPVCSLGQEASGSEGCWGCCQPVDNGVTAVPETSPVPREVESISCTKWCNPNKPLCSADQKASGFEDCWGCCVPI